MQEIIYWTHVMGKLNKNVCPNMWIWARALIFTNYYILAQNINILTWNNFIMKNGYKIKITNI